MNDQLIALKNREVASLERTESLHEKIMKRKSWTGAYLGTIEGNMGAQKEIADDADAFKEKIKEAKVFHSLLDKPRPRWTAPARRWRIAARKARSASISRWMETRRLLTPRNSKTSNWRKGHRSPSKASRQTARDADRFDQGGNRPDG